MVPRLLTEFIGTFFLVLTIGLTVLIGTAFAPVAIGFVLVALVYMGGPISGAHYNPAVTLAFWMQKGIPSREVGPYVAAQVTAALAAAAAVYVVLGRTLKVAPGVDTGLGPFFLLEVLFTFALCLVILNVAADERAGNDYYGLAIGSIVLVGAFAAGPISGGAFNPAVALGPILVDVLVSEGTTVGGLWVYLTATFAGALLAVGAYRLQHPAAPEPVR